MRSNDWPWEPTRLARGCCWNIGDALNKMQALLCTKKRVFVRFLPDIRYGTENYPEKVARRLRAVNLAAWIGAAVAAFGFANFLRLEFLNPKPGLWKAAVVLALGASIWASVPLLHRFGALCGALTAILMMQAYLFSLTWLIGTGSGLQMLYLVAAALIFVFGRERFFLFVVLGILAVLQVVLLQIIVPARCRRAISVLFWERMPKVRIVPSVTFPIARL